ncbi:lipoprotein-releasing system ATP-binding protein LolD, partial [Xanthomonas perforans]|nr:lipoprotein-releasing system ATP-binding protein LolD [Xanthomonas perforans]
MNEIREAAVQTSEQATAVIRAEALAKTYA